MNKDVIVNRDIEYLDDWQHMLIRPGMYIGSVEPMEEKIHIIENGNTVMKNKIYSVGMYRIFDEVLDNAFDEAIRCVSEYKPMTKIEISVNTELNSISVSDTGQGFKDGIKKNKKTNLTNIETALTKLRSGSNFTNDDSELNLIGTNGIGISATNVFSEVFEITTKNINSEYYHRWENFTSVTSDIKQKTNKKNTGTTITFIPRKDIFKEQKWDLEILKTKLLFRNFIKNNNETLKNIKLVVKFDNEDVNLRETIFPKDFETITLNKKMKLFVWKSFENSANISFVNGSLCTGFHQKYVQEYLNKIFFDYDKAHQFYNNCIIIDLPPKYVLFQEQNKTRFVTTREKMEEILKLAILKKDFREISTSKTFVDIKKAIEEFLQSDDLKKIKKAKKNNKVIISDKFISSTKKEIIMLTEGLSASGSLAQIRNPEIHSIYALRGKIKNAKTISELSENNELMELTSILNLNFDDKGETCDYKKIIIATDADADGYHIAALIINFFSKWYPNIIKNNKLYILKTPIVAVDTDKKSEYYYSLDDLNLATTKNVRYLKGLGSLDIEDWKYVYDDMKLVNVIYDDKSVKMLNMAFGDDSKLRKTWLMK